MIDRRDMKLLGLFSRKRKTERQEASDEPADSHGPDGKSPGPDRGAHEVNGAPAPDD
jgi:hypothetical protein